MPLPNSTSINNKEYTNSFTDEEKKTHTILNVVEKVNSCEVKSVYDKLSNIPNFYDLISLIIETESYYQIQFHDCEADLFNELSYKDLENISLFIKGDFQKFDKNLMSFYLKHKEILSIRPIYKKAYKLLTREYKLKRILK